jgi:signal transduction histidine kinase
MRISVRVRTIIVMNLLVIGVAVVLGKIAGEVAGQVVEDRLASELAKNTSSFLHDRKLPFTDSLMRYLSQMFGVEVATFQTRDGKTVASSLSPAQTEELRKQVAGRSSGNVTLDGQVFRFDSNDILQSDHPEERGEPMRLCLVVPQKQFQDARDKALERMTALALPAVGVATVLAFALSVTITGPIRKLAAQTDRLSEQATREAENPQQAALAPERSISIRRGPSEVVRLAESFNHLLSSLHKVQTQLAQSERLATLGSVAASVAHELRNPLSGIKMNVRVLRDQAAGGPEDDESLRIILREIDRMDLYLQELLSLAGSPSPRPLAPGSAQSVREPVQLEAIADSVLALLEGRCKHEGIDVRRDFTPAPAVLADGNQIRQVIMNLVINAIEAMPDGGVVRLALEAGRDGRVRLGVTDTGRGVQSPAGADIFEPFVTTKPGSSGLGLHLCRQIIRDHGGEIGYNNLEQGATFWFELPGC